MIAAVIRHGSWAASPDVEGLRWVTFNGREVLRGLAPTVRDADWRTIQPEIAHSATPSAAQVSCTASYRSTNVTVDIELSYVLDHDGLRMRSLARILATTVAGRIGLCALLPLSVVGCRWWATGDGELAVDRIPRTIWPTFLGRRVQRLHWGLGGGDLATLSLAGDRWDIEDQRNWSDASFKAFTPPFVGRDPRTYQAGEQIEHEVWLQVGSARRHAAPAAPAQPTEPSHTASVVVGNRLGASLPPIGCLLTGDPGHATTALARLAPTHLRLSLDLRDHGWRSKLARGNAVARQTGAALVLELIQAGVDPLLPALAEALADRDSLVGEILAFDAADDRGAMTSTEAQLVAVRAALRQAGSSVPIGGGSRANFREFNDPSQPVAVMELVTFGISPQVHAVDNATILENLETLPALVAEARRITRVVPLDVACTLRPRLDPYRRVPIASLDEDRMDPRLHTSFGAAWVVGVLASLAASGAHRLTVLEATGPAGWVSDGAASPLADVLAAVPRRGWVLPVRADPVLACLAVGDRQRQVVIAANLAGRPLDVSFRLLGRTVEKVSVLGGTDLVPDGPRRFTPGASRVDVRLMPLGIAIIVAWPERTRGHQS